MIGSKKVTVIIPSAGLGKRMGSLSGGISKQFVSLQGRPLLSHTIQKFEKSQYVDEIIIVCSSEVIPYVKTEIVTPFQFDKVTKVVSGGKERQDSVYEGFKAIDHADLVLVHDGVRPFVRTERIDELIVICNDTGAALLAVRPKDTIKSQDLDQNVQETLDRTTLWTVQTPQAFNYVILKKAFEYAYTRRYYGTDESMLVEKIGDKIRIVEGDHENIKITSPYDLILADFILNGVHKQF